MPEWECYTLHGMKMFRNLVNRFLQAISFIILVIIFILPMERHNFTVKGCLVELNPSDSAVSLKQSDYSCISQINFWFPARLHNLSSNSSDNKSSDTLSACEVT